LHCREIFFDELLDEFSLGPQFQIARDGIEIGLRRRLCSSSSASVGFASDVRID
jgi:hypothetical protein